jgi:hypothetical protein
MGPMPERHGLEGDERTQVFAAMGTRGHHTIRWRLTFAMPRVLDMLANPDDHWSHGGRGCQSLTVGEGNGLAFRTPEL